MPRQKTSVLLQSVRKLLRRGAHSHLTNLLVKLHPGDISTLMLQMAEREQSAIFSLLMRTHLGLSAEILKTLGPERGLGLLKRLTVPEISDVLQELESDSAALFISALPEELGEEVLERMRVKESEEVKGLLLYPQQTAGRIMTPNVFCLREDVTVEEAIRTIQRAEELEMVFYLYVVDDRNHLVGVISLRQLLMVPPSTPLGKIMTCDVLSVDTGTDQEEVARQVALYDLLAIPVVDEENKLVGVVTVDDVIDVIKEEATEDIFYLAGVDADDRTFTPARTSVRKRLPWLAVNLVTAMLAATAVAFYEPTIARFSFLAIFLPVVAGMGGNSGTQTLTVIVRGLALGDLSWKTSRSVFAKEVLVGMANGVSMGLLAGLVAYLWIGRPLLGVVLAAAMIINMLVAALVGTLVPLCLKTLNVDPAIASSIFVTTFTDVVGFLSFLGLATYLLYPLSGG